MKPHYEQPTITADTSWNSFIRREVAFDFAWHFHREYELTLITEGTGIRYVGTTVQPYRPRELVLLGPDLPHTFTSVPYEGGMAEAAVAQFREDFLGAGFLALPQFADVAALLVRAGGGLLCTPPRSLYDDLAALPALPPAERTLGLGHALHWLARLDCEPLTGPGYAPPPDAGARRRIDQVCRHLQQAHTGRVELAEVAALAHMSATSFSRFFRRTMGRTLTDYVNQLRIETACRLLSGTELPITAVAARSGYQNLSNFNRRFRELKRMRPSDYRSAHWPQQ